jgi:uncharacterized RDD family membrane protein YckC
MTQEDTNYAGFWRRWAAYVLDSVIIGYVANDFYFMLLSQFSGDLLLAQIFLGIFTFGLSWVYFAGMESSPLRATLGKLAVGLFVSSEDGERVSFAQATGRFFGKIISALILSIGFLMAGWTSRKQALHDIMAGTLVLRK